MEGRTEDTFFRNTEDRLLLGPGHRNCIPRGSNCFVLGGNLLSFLVWKTVFSDLFYEHGKSFSYNGFLKQAWLAGMS
jgi:hypothetical protein